MGTSLEAKNVSFPTTHLYLVPHKRHFDSVDLDQT